MTRRTFLATLGASAMTRAIPAWAVPRSDLDLIARQQGAPLMVQLARAMQRLTSTLTFMTTGAHPDDEPSAMLAALRYHYGVSPVIYCITRGEGGQNNIGPERGVALGVLRTREMQEACRALDARLVFGGEDMHDTVTDFGFSKDPHDTLHRWNEDIVVERMVRAIREYRPDIIFNCFNDVPGQHGHHRAAVLVTDKAVDLAARDDAYPRHFIDGLKPWRVAKVYDPSWGGGGSTYDDENPPPKTTLVVNAPLRDAISGATWPQMGEWSRACHLTQKMGRWIAEPQTDWPLSLRHGGYGEEKDIRDHLPATLAALADVPGVDAASAQALRDAQQLVDDMAGRYAEPGLVLEKALKLAKVLKKITLPAEHAQRLERKKRETDAVIALAAGVQARSFIEGKTPAHSGEVSITTLIDAPESVQVQGVTIIARGDLPVEGERIVIPADAVFTNPMPAVFDPMGGNGDAWTQIRLQVGEHRFDIKLDLEDPLRIVPQASVQLHPQALLLNRAKRLPLQVDALLRGATVDELQFVLPPAWHIQPGRHISSTQSEFRLLPPEELADGRLAIVPQIAGKDAWKIEEFSYPHTGRVIVPTLATLALQIVDAALPKARVAYIGSNNDHVATWLKRMGVDVAELDTRDVQSGAFQAFDTLVIGVFAFGKRADLQQALPAIHEWVKNGGHLLTLYHRPSDGWKADSVPPAYLKIGSPSIRYRVTDENAPVTHLAPDHSLLNYPNKISEEDWQGWDKERGLYFAAEWDDAYVPLLAMSDA
ncbi:MAG: PIG-L family deacetylase, partial [Cardiobacteriaceae bacterium]|nr:PIG-L family deacetylase [Cardiobacteriaceae bacterium]